MQEKTVEILKWIAETQGKVQRVVDEEASRLNPYDVAPAVEYLFAALASNTRLYVDLQKAEHSREANSDIVGMVE